MTIKQYQTLAKTIASKIKELGGNPQRVRSLEFPDGMTVSVRDPKQCVDNPTTFKSGESNATIKFDTISNPNNPNYKFRTLKPGSMSFYNSQTNVNVDITKYNFDTAQFAVLLEMLKQPGWEIVKQS